MGEAEAGEGAGSRRTGRMVPCLDRPCLGNLSAMPGCADRMAEVGGRGSFWRIGKVGRTDGLQISRRNCLQPGAMCTLMLVSMPGGCGQRAFDRRQKVLQAQASHRE